MFLYEIKSRYIPTGKMRTVKIEAPNKDEAIRYFRLDSDFSVDFEIEEIFIPPTDRQLDYAKDLKIRIPENASVRDVSALIDREVNHDSDPNPDLIEFAKGRGILFSDYIGKKALYNLTFHNLPQLDKIAFFAFSVYRWLSDDRQGNLDIHPQRQLFYDYAQPKVNDEKFIKSMDQYQGEDIRFFGKIEFSDGGEAHGGSTSTIAYKDCANYLNEELGLQKNKIKKFTDEVRKPVKSNNPTTNKESVSKAAIIVVVLISIGVIWLMIKFLSWLFL